MGIARQVSKNTIRSSIKKNARNNLTFSSNNTQFSSMTAINHEVTTTIDDLMNNSVEWSGRFSFTMPESDFTSDVKYNVMGYIDDNDIARSSLAYSLSFTANIDDDNCVSSLLTDEMKLQLANVGLLGHQQQHV